MRDASVMALIDYQIDLNWGNNPLIKKKRHIYTWSFLLVVGGIILLISGTFGRRADAVVPKPVSPGI